jgi:penicillin amidase
LWTEWWNHLYKLTWDEFEQTDVALKKPFTYQTIYLLKNKPNETFADIVATPAVEAAKDLFLISFQSAMSVFDTWDAESPYKWSKYKGTAARHLLQGLPAFSRFDIPIGGEENSPNAVTHDHGPSWRMIVEMSSPPKALGIYPGGQSGNPGSVYYDNFIDTWAAGDYFEAIFMQSTTDTKHIRSTQTLSPKS